MLKGWDITELSTYGADSLSFHGRLVLELGPGGGALALALAQKNRSDFHVLVDMNEGNVRNILRLIRKSGLKNIGVVHGIAHLELFKIPDAIKFDVIHCHFPSPYNPKLQNVPRLYGEETCAQIMRLTQIGSELFVTSDKRRVIRDFQSLLKSKFRVQAWNSPIKPLIDGAIVGTENERIFCINRNITASYLHMTRS